MNQTTDNLKGRLVLINPEKKANKGKKPGAIGKLWHWVEGINDIVVVYLSEYNYFDTYAPEDLLTFYPDILDNLIGSREKLEKADIKCLLRVYHLILHRHYGDAFSLALKNTKIRHLCLTDGRWLLRQARSNLKGNFICNTNIKGM